MNLLSHRQELNLRLTVYETVVLPLNYDGKFISPILSDYHANCSIDKAYNYWYYSIMNTLTAILPANEARSNFYPLLDMVGDELRQFTITLRGKAKAVIMSIEEFGSWQETLEVMSDKKLVQSVKKGLSSQKVYSQEQADKIIKW